MSNINQIQGRIHQMMKDYGITFPRTQTPQNLTIAEIANQQLGQIIPPKVWPKQHKTMHPLLMFAKYLWEAIKYKIETVMDTYKHHKHIEIRFLLNSLKNQHLINDQQFDRLDKAAERGGRALKQEIHLLINHFNDQGIVEPRSMIDFTLRLKNNNGSDKQVLKMLLAIAVARDYESIKERLRNVMTEEELELLNTDIEQGRIDDETTEELAIVNARLQLLNWASTLPLEYQEMVRGAIQINHPTHFRNLMRTVFSEIKASLRDNPVQARKFRELSEAMAEKMHENSYVQLAHMIETQNHLTNWNEQLLNLESELETYKTTLQNSDHELDPTEKEKLQEVLKELEVLYRIFGRVLRHDKSFMGCETQFAHEMGFMRKQWRTIGTMMHALLPNDASDHTFCSCVHDDRIKGMQLDKQKPDFKAEELWIDLDDHEIKGTDYIPKREAGQQMMHDTAKKTALFFYCNWGGGHKSATNALQQYLGRNEYHTVAVDTPNQVLISTDPVHQIVGGDYTVTTMFNTLLAGLHTKYITALRKLRRSGPEPAEQAMFRAMIRDRVLKEQPEIIVSVYGMHNNYLREVAEELGIPFLVVGTDMDCSETWWLEKDHKHVKMGLPYNIPEMHEKYKGLLDSEDVVDIGYPIRPGFLKEKSAEEIESFRRKHGIAPDEKVILLTNGSCGGDSKWIEKLMESSVNEIPEKCRVFAICGRSKDLETDLIEYNRKNHRSFNPNLKLSVKGWVGEEEMVELQEVADVCIGKPGGSYVAEALVANTQFLANHTKHLMEWEAYCAEQLKENDLGDEFQDESEFLPKVSEQLKKEHIDNPTFRHKESEERFVRVVEKMISEAEADQDYLAKRKKWKSLFQESE